MANGSTKTTQTSVQMAQHNERTRLHDSSCTPTNLCVHQSCQPCSFIVLSHLHTCLCGFCRSVSHSYVYKRQKHLQCQIGMANKSTKTTQTSVWMAQHNERTRLHDLSCTPTNLRMRALVVPTQFVHCVEPSTHLFVWFLSIRQPFLPPLTL